MWTNNKLIDCLCSENSELGELLPTAIMMNGMVTNPKDTSIDWTDSRVIELIDGIYQELSETLKCYKKLKRNLKNYLEQTQK
jgi:hypothetical protein